MKRTLLIIALSLSVVSALSAAPPVSLTLHPAKIPSPALKYPLLPDQRRLTNDDAAPLYREAIKTAQRSQVLQPDELYTKWLNTPLAQLPRQRVAEQLKSANEVFALLDKAACCERCDWGLLEGLRKEGFKALGLERIQEVEALERIGLLLAVRVRLHLAEGRFDEAVKGLQTALALAKHVGEGHGVRYLNTGYALTEVRKQLDTYVEQPGAPNLYWSLAALPRPLIDLRYAMHGQRIGIYNLTPSLADVLADPQAGTMAAEQLQQLDGFLVAISRDKPGTNEKPTPNFLQRKAFVDSLMAKHETAKQALIAAGRPRDKVEAMPHVQVALLHSLLEFDRQYDDLLKWRNSPYWEIAAFTKEQEEARRAKKRAPDAPVVPLGDKFLGSQTEQLFRRQAQLERDFALWRTIEALRDYAATHDNKLPPNLTAIKEVPIPLDPVTGKDFVYQLDGDTATLRATPPARESPNSGNSVVYELQIRK